jgi:hypothetical protein
MKRMRGRNHRPNGGGGGNNGGGFRNQQNGIPLNRNHVFDSSGPEMRIRGTAQQLYEKYQQLARDASSNGDRVTGESYYQHAEHYFRIISAINQAQGHPAQGQVNGQNGQPYQNAGQGGYAQSGDRNGNHMRQVEGRSSEPEGQNGQHNGHYNNQNRRPFEHNNGERQQDLQLSQPQHTDTGPAEPQRTESRPVEARAPETRPAEGRPAEGRPTESRPFEPRRNDQPRNRPDFQRNNERQERFRPEAPVVDTRIDISSALEAELAAAVAEPPEPPVLEARAIPIIPDAPPPAAAAPAAPKPRGRPRTVKAAPKE